jgi:putative hydrolase of HD superfamily
MLDKVQPLFLNEASNGRSWEEHGVKKSQVLNRNSRTHEGSEKIWEYARGIIERAAAAGKLIDE